MRTADYPEVPDDFGNWLAGFIDGEGHFAIAHNEGRGFRCYFVVAVRRDEVPILDEIIRVTGIGWKRLHGPYQFRQPKASPAADWRITSRDGCLALVRLLDRFPLRAKKASDYAIWRAAVLDWATTVRANQSTGGRDWTAIAQAKADLAENRRYRPA